jgi:transposase InsO family protein
MAMKTLGNRSGVIHHSDRGFQYGCQGMIDLATKHNVTLSMTEDNHVYENALAERVNGILKDEFLIGETKLPYTELEVQVARSIRVYNNERLHTALAYKTPMQSFN